MPLRDRSTRSASDAHPQPAAGGVGELEQRVVLGERQAVRRLELLVEPPGEPGVGVQERPPRAEARVGRGDGVAAAGAAVGHVAAAGAVTSSDVIAAILTHPDGSLTMQLSRHMVASSTNRGTPRPLATPRPRSRRTTPMTATTWKHRPRPHRHPVLRQAHDGHDRPRQVRRRRRQPDPRRGRPDARPAGSFTVRAASLTTGIERARRPPPVGRLLRRRDATPRSRSSRPRVEPEARQRLRASPATSRSAT